MGCVFIMHDDCGTSSLLNRVGWLSCQINETNEAAEQQRFNLPEQFEPDLGNWNMENQDKWVCNSVGRYFNLHGNRDGSVGESAEKS